MDTNRVEALIKETEKDIIRQEAKAQKASDAVWNSTAVRVI